MTVVEILLAIDGGGSRTRCLAMGRDGRRLGEGASGPSNHLQVPREVALHSLADAIGAALVAGGVGFHDVILVSAGLAGVDYNGAGAPQAEAMFLELGFRRLMIHGDMVIAHRGALGGRPGVLALAGTGASFLGIGSRNQLVKAGGWGPVYGDEGSANWIGRRALEAAAHAWDGRGPQTSLLPALCKVMDLATFQDSIARVYGEAMSPREIAALCQPVCLEAAAGDEVAAGILSRAGEELARAVSAVIGRLDLAVADCPVSYQGAVLESCGNVRENFIDALRRALPGISVEPPLLEPVMGAYLLGCETLGWEVGGYRVVGNVSDGVAQDPG